MSRTSSRARSLVTRRRLLRGGAQAAGGLGLSLFGDVVAVPTAGADGAEFFGPLQPADANGLMLPYGFTSRVVAETGSLVGSSGYSWHGAPDGGATFATAGGGWIYVSNSELGDGNGGAGAIVFGGDGAILDAYGILTGRTRCCAGGPTPWSTWLSGEEFSGGMIWECDPFSPGSQGVARPAMGVFRHEAAAVDPIHEHVYLTEDETGSTGGGLVYRFTPSAYPDLSAGALEAAEILGAGAIAPGETRSLAWHTIPNPAVAGGGNQDPLSLPSSDRATRYQLDEPTHFDGAEGVWYEDGNVYFATKGDNRVWRIDTAAQTIEIRYDLATTTMPSLSGVDNVTGSSAGDVYVAEDGGNMEIVALTPGGDVEPIMRLVGTSGSEITGPALSPAGNRLYFSSQRNPGRTYEVRGPFLANRQLPPGPLVPAMGGAGHGLVVGALAAATLFQLRRRRLDELASPGDGRSR